MFLQKYFKCGDFEEIWDKELECVDEGEEGKDLVYILNLDIVIIFNRKKIQKKIFLKVVFSVLFLVII